MWGVHPTPVPIPSPPGSHGAVDGSKGCGMERHSRDWFHQLPKEAVSEQTMA